MAKSPTKKTTKKSSKSKANATQDLFGSDYTAKDIEVLEGLEPVRKRPGMYLSLIHISEPTRPY